MFLSNLVPTSVKRLVSTLLAPLPLRKNLRKAVPQSKEEYLAAIKAIDQDFLRGIDYKPLGTPVDTVLREALNAEIESWNLADMSPKLKSKLTVSAGTMTESCYGHLDYKFRLFAGLYTLFFFYADDYCERFPEACGDFARRFISGEKQGDHVLEKYAQHIRSAFDLYPLEAATSIVAASLEFINANYMENVTSQKVTIYKHAKGQTACWPFFLRSRSAIGVAFGHLAFPLSEEYKPADYIQLIPEFDRLISWSNDVLSYYKEWEAGETTGYIMTRAEAEGKHPIQALRETSNDSMDNIRRISLISGHNTAIHDMAMRFTYGYIEFHFRTPRYRLSELGFEASA